ncbi:Bud site selection protein 6 [Tulasnella sp. 419]|nr:Bud site selection protein 6 [Tulasnella sp. 419]
MSTARSVRSERTNGTSSSRSSSSRTAIPSTPQVETTVTRLLVAIKQLLESLTSWSLGKITENDVSDVYVTLGNDFNACVEAFSSIGINMQELLSVPDDLRAVLEQALAEDANPENLELFLPHVRAIITNLLQGLRAKQSLYRKIAEERNARRSERSDSGVPSSSRSSRSGSQPRPLPSTEGSRPQPQPGSVASAVPARVSSGVGRRKVSGSRQTSQSDTEGPQRRTGGGFVPSLGQATVATSSAQGDGVIDVSSRSSTEEQEPLAPTVLTRRKAGSFSASLIDPKSDRPNPARTSSSRSVSSTFEENTEDAVATPQAPPPPPAVPPGVKRYSLIDAPVSPKPQAASPPYLPPPKFPPALTFETPTPTSSEPSLLQSESPGTPPAAALNASPTPDNALYQTPAMEQSLAALQQTGALDRKASKRFSTFTISKMGISGGGGASKPPSSNKSLNRRSIAPSASVGQLSAADLDALAEVDEDATSPVRQSVSLKPTTPKSTTVDDSTKRGPSPLHVDEKEKIPPVPPIPATLGSDGGVTPKRGRSPDLRAEDKLAPPKATSMTKSPTVVNGTLAPPVPTASPEPVEAPRFITVFLQVARQVKKVRIDFEESPDLSFAALRVLFVDRFSYNPGQDNFPAIYIRDPKSGVQYELEDVGEVKDGCLLSLNIEPLDQIKQHIDLQISNLSNDLKDLKTAVGNTRRMSLTPGPSINGINGTSHIEDSPPAPRPTEQQFQSVARRLSKLRHDDLSKIGSAPSTRFNPQMAPLVEQSTGSTFQSTQFQPLTQQMTGGSTFTFSSETGTSARIVSDLKTQFDEVRNLRRDLGVMKQVYVDFISQTKETLGNLRNQTTTVRNLANTKIGGTRAYIDSGKSQLDSRSQNVLTKVEELQDMVEALRDDVLKRHITPKANVVKTLKADVESTRAELESLTEHLATIKPMWKNTWEKELQNIVEEQQFLTHQEEFVRDLMEDHNALSEVFGHVQKVISIKSASAINSGIGGRGGKILRTGRSFKPPPKEEGHDGFSTVMLEIKGAEDDKERTERRLRAIEANTKQRQKELRARGDDFEEELSDFVGQKKLKKTGGAEEAERIRLKKDQAALKSMFSNGAPIMGSNGAFSLDGGYGSGSDFGGMGGAALGMAGVTFSSAPLLDDDED